MKTRAALLREQPGIWNIRDEHGRLGVLGRAEAEDRRRLLERLGEVRAAARSRSRRRRAAASRTSSRKPLPSGPKIAISSPGSSSAIARVPGPTGSTRKPSSPRGAWQSESGRGRTRPGASSMKNWPGVPGSSAPRRDAQERVGADPSRRRRPEALTTRHASPPRSGRARHGAPGARPPSRRGRSRSPRRRRGRRRAS